MAQAAINKPAQQINVTYNKDAGDQEVTAPAWMAVSRTVALFWGLLSMINLIGELRHQSSMANIWWIDLQGVPGPYARGFLAVVAVLLISFALKSRLPGFIQKMGIVVVLFLLVITGWDAYQFLQTLKAAPGNTPSVLPFTAYVAVCMLIILLGLFARSDPLGHPGRTFILASITGGLCIVGFSLAQIYAFGKQDQRQNVQSVAVFSNQLPAGALAEQAISKRIGLAVEIYKADTAKKIILIGSDRADAINAIAIMKQQAVNAGVSIDDLKLVVHNGETGSAAIALARFAQEHQQKHLLVVSDFYHLLRIKLYSAQLGLQVSTVPAQTAYQPGELFPLLLKESVALWSYYLQPLAPEET